ncbi:MAG: glycosyltransferase [Myxococcales bacterium]|nr:glycosyltransferase [Myxococcales bacterium]
MHIAYALDLLASGGAQRQLVELACFLQRERGIRVSVLTYYEHSFHQARLQAAGVPVIDMGRRSKFSATFVAKARAWLRAERPDLLHAFLLGPGVWFGLAAAGMGSQRPAFIAAERGSLLCENVGRLLARTALGHAADAVTVNSEVMTEAVVQRLRVPAARVHYVPNGIDLPRWDRLAAQPCPWDLEPGRVHLALVGRLQPEKGHVYLLRAIARLEPHLRECVRLWCVGAATGGAGESNAIVAESDRLGLGDVVRFVPATHAIAPLLARLHGVVLPSLHEGFPNVVLEAMASRLPVVASGVGDVANLIDPERSGRIVPPADVPALADALAWLLQQTPEQRSALGGRGRAIIEERYAMPLVADRYLTVYRAVLAARAAP